MSTVAFGAHDWLELPVATSSVRLRSTPAGLDAGDAASRLAAIGPNALAAEPSQAAGRLLLRQLANPMIVILLVASAVSGILRDFADTAIIIGVVVGFGHAGFCAGIPVFARGRAAAGTPHAALPALRGGTEQEIAVRNLVPGDVVLLRAGSMLPADGRLLAARDLHVNEALLTGESLPAGKAPDAADRPRPRPVHGDIGRERHRHIAGRRDRRGERDRPHRGAAERADGRHRVRAGPARLA